MEAFSRVPRRRQKRTLFLELQIGCLDHIREHLDVRIDLFPELLAGTAAGVDRHGLELLAHSWVGKRAPRFRTELIGDRGQRAGHHEYPAPKADIHLRVACLPHTWHVRKLGGAFRSGHRQRADLAALHSGIVGGPSAMANNVVPPATLSIISLLLL